MNSNSTVKKILVLAANPKQTGRLRLDEEVRYIKEGLRLAQKRDQFLIEQEWAVRPRDIRRAILNYRPNIIHFSGHGSGANGLYFEDETGNPQLVTGEALAGLFEQFAKQIECVLLNACYAQMQADVIVQHIDYVIGMNDSIDDKAAIEFAVGFYDALAAHNPEYDQATPVEFAFAIARNAIALAGVSGESIPVLKKKTNLATLDNLINVPDLPLHFLPRPEHLETLKQEVLGNTKKPVVITGMSRRVGVQGMGGIGKTVLATALARDEEVRQAFPDGVLWVTLGQTPQLLSLQTELAKVLGDSQAVFTEIGLGKTRLRELLADKACLLILDDIWQREHAEAFDVLGERCQMLITTRDAAIITDLGAKGHELKILSKDLKCRRCGYQ
ncbi:NB-ARC domain-containing protein [Brasilonema octagenarum]|uniref:CHAT domain-containing protein n=1 Tax=Brasilonema octagenarum UFV-OR1 TaxID=417115 RepID=A0ABX1MF26_9CYAN|nr:NB-ARC domain-containing protein [Brasilonema octagenarum]NMF66411.1 hypothetical protein [Brasilonema octagenarum UFV-OR1]